MSFKFSEQDIQRIGRVLETEPKPEGNLVRFELKDPESGRHLALEIHMTVERPAGMRDESPANMISVYTSNSFLQLQNSTGFVASGDLGEVIFFARRSGSLNGLVVEKAAGCSLYANVDERLLSADFTRLPPELMMSSVALSITETMFDDVTGDAR